MIACCFYNLLAFLILIALSGSNAQGSCKDSSGCEGVSRWCSNKQIAKMCPVTCDTCPTTPPPTNTCKDIDSRCSGWTDFCTTSTYVQENCKKTCDLCDSWSPCTKTCGGGTRFKNTCDDDGTNCRVEFEECGMENCRVVDCKSGELYRYGMNHSCCVDDSFFASCGSSSLSSKVIGGKKADAKRWSWMAAVITKQGHFCAASLINKKYVVSAAHCFRRLISGKLYDTKEWEIHLGITRLSSKPREMLTRTIKRVTTHPDYDYPTNDIALVEMNKKVKYSSFIQPICLPGGEVTPLDTKCFVTGWGVSENSGGSTTNHLQEAEIFNLDKRICQSAYKDISLMDEVMPLLNSGKGYLCAGHLTKKIDSCSGDSGGPLVCQRCSSCTWYVAGVVSFGHYDCGTTGVPGVYTSVVEAEKWINTIVNIESDSYTCKQIYGP